MLICQLSKSHCVDTSIENSFNLLNGKRECAANELTFNSLSCKMVCCLLTAITNKMIRRVKQCRDG